MKLRIAFGVAILAIASVPLLIIYTSRDPEGSRDKGVIGVKLGSKGYQYLDGYWESYGENGELEGCFAISAGNYLTTKKEYRYRTQLTRMEEGEEYGLMLSGNVQGCKTYINGDLVLYSDKATNESRVARFTSRSDTCEVVLQGEGRGVLGRATPPLLFKWKTYQKYRDRTLTLAAFFLGLYACFFLIVNMMRGNVLNVLLYSLIGVAYYFKSFIWVFVERNALLDALQQPAVDALLYIAFIAFTLFKCKSFLDMGDKMGERIHLVGILTFVAGMTCERTRVLGVAPLEWDFVLPVSIGIYLFTYGRGVVRKEGDVLAYIIERKLLTDENKEQSTQLMVNQIKPHFIYNVLLTIKVLCRNNAEEAEEAITTFSEYLRENLNTISAKRPIPLKNEIDHVKNYLYLEKMRFGNRINATWDISVEEVEIPALTLQVLVENAIRHGIGKKEEGGTISISSSCEKGYYVIIVEDDGIGFDVESTMDERKWGTQYSTLWNVKQRIQFILGGEMTYESKVGEGTRVTITIPYANG